MFEKEWFPKAFSIGVTWKEFWTLNPKIINLMIEGYKEKKQAELEEKNYFAYIQGSYFAEAIMSTIGNVFVKGKKHKYPEKPYELKRETETISQNDVEKQRELFVAKLQLMKINHELNN